MPVNKYVSHNSLRIQIAKYTLSLLLLIGNLCFAQNKSYDDVLYQAVVKTAGTDMALAKKMADSLYRSSVEPIHKVKSLMLLSDLNLTTGKKKEGINYAFQAEQIASENNLFEWQARIYGYIATHYRSIGLRKQSKLYLNKGLEAINNVTDVHIVNQYKALVYQELALYDIENKNYRQAIVTLKKAEPYFKHIRNKELRLYQLASNYGQLGRAYLDLKDTKTAVQNFKKALSLLSQIQHEATIVKGFMYEGLGRAFLEEKAFKKARPFLDKALAIATTSNDMSLNEEVYCDLAIYYLETGNKEKFKHYNELFQAARDKTIQVNKESSEIVVNRLEERQNEIALQHNLVFGLLGTVLLCLLIIVFVGRARRKKEYKRFQEILKYIHSAQSSRENLQSAAPVDVPALQQNDKEIMSKEAEDIILEKLLVFEQGNSFTNNNLTLSGLSVMLETNNKYLSYVINKHKMKDFNNYINELRILYIIKKLESSPEYLNYKISYLAEECGFSSHSKFTDKFKSVAGMSPSSFIGFLKKEQTATRKG